MHISLREHDITTWRLNSAKNWNYLDKLYNNLLTIYIDSANGEFTVNIYVPNDLLGYFDKYACMGGLYVFAKYVYENGLEYSNIFEVVEHYLARVTNDNLVNDLDDAENTYENNQERIINMSTNLGWFFNVDEDEYTREYLVPTHLCERNEKPTYTMLLKKDLKETVLKQNREAAHKYKGFENAD